MKVCRPFRTAVHSYLSLVRNVWLIHHNKSLFDHAGGRDFTSLKAFAEESLKPSCSDARIDLCDDEQKTKLSEFRAMSAEERKALIDEAKNAVEKLETDFNDAVKKLQARYEELQKEKDDIIAATTTPELRLLKTIQN